MLVEALQDERMTVRFHALKGLRRLKYKKGLKEIAKLLGDESGGIRVNALAALMELGDTSLLPLVAKSLHDEQWYVRQVASEACGKFGVGKARAQLEKL